MFQIDIKHQLHMQGTILYKGAKIKKTYTHKKKSQQK